jgi:cytochrome c553
MAASVQDLGRFDTVAISTHYAQKPWPDLEQSPASGEITQKAEQLIANGQCTASGCHVGFVGEYGRPRIAGQSEAYVIAALKSYQSKTRRHDAMGEAVKGLSEADVRALAAYLAGLKP